MARNSSAVYKEKKTYLVDLIKGVEVAQNGWTDQEAEIQEDAIWGINPEALYHMKRAEYKTEPDNIAIEILLRFFNENQRETYITTAENSFGQKRTKSKHLKSSGADLKNLKRNARSKE